ncbi:MAG TPA: hypothetical protein VMW87_13125, partial [Spirochaetia bacterium]|nr:hypothetical protein [Spirochaetia bacterium]
DRSRGVALQFGDTRADDQRSMDHSRSGGSKTGTSITALIGQTRRLIENGTESFQRMHARDEELFSALDEGFKKLSSLDEVIGRIKEDSIEMELISLNAMTVALKAGSAGRAFSYITEELKRLSSRTISLTEEITGRGEQLLRIFHDFRTSLSEIKEFQDNLFGDLQGKLEMSLLSIQKEIGRTANALGSISSRSAEIRAPLNAAMEEIQLHEVIKQSVDPLIISLRELSEASVSETPDERLDELSFFQQLPDLCHALLEDVAQKIQNSITVFGKEIGAARGVIAEVERERDLFVNGTLVKTMRRSDAARPGSGTAQSEESLEVLFERSTNVLRGLLADLARSMSMKEQLTERSRGLVSEIFKLEEGFKSFAIVINRFHSIDVASRIEVVKQAVLQKMSGTVDEMTLLTERIERDVNESLDSIKAFIKTINQTISELRKVFQEEETFVTQFEKSMRAGYDQLLEEKDTIAATLSGFSLFTRNFLSMFDSTTQDLTRLEVLLTDIAQIRTKLDETKRLTRSEMEPLLQQKGVTAWKIGNHRLQQIIARFANLTHQ